MVLLPRQIRVTWLLPRWRHGKAQLWQHPQVPIGRYQARYFYRGAWYKADHTFRTKADAAAWLSIKQAEITGGTWIDPGLTGTLFQEYANRWMKTRTDLARTTRGKYDGLLRLHIFPKFGRVELGRLSATAVPGTTSSATGSRRARQPTTPTGSCEPLSTRP